MFKDQLYANGAKNPVTVRLNSPGGDLIAASVIAAMLKDYPADVTVKVDGIAASAAVMVAMAADRVVMNASAYMMVHNPMVGLLGFYNVDDLKGFVDELKTIKQGIIEGYQQKTSLEPEKIAKLMDEETWMTASEAVAFGFADEISTGAKRSNYVNFASMLTNYVNTPAALLHDAAGEETPTPEPEAETSEPPQAKVDPAQVEKLRNYLKVYKR
jgi:ATP-dependent Clp protease protease subunit